MDVKNIIKNTLIAFLAQGISMLLSIIQSLVIPKMLGVTEYGFWQLFIFYSSYVGFFHLGLNDGIYLVMGGKGRDVIDKKLVKSQFVLLILTQTIVALVIIFLSELIVLDANRRFVITATAIYLVIQNAATYLMFILQAMNETKYSSGSTIVNRLTFLIPLVFLLLRRSSSFQLLVIGYTISSFLQLVYCIYHCYDILSSRTDSIRVAIAHSFTFIRVGSKLMIANIASQLILGFLRLSIDAKWGVETFGRLSLSLSLVNFFLAFVTQAAMVLFPALRQSDNSEVKQFYVTARDLLSLTFPIVYLLYYPMVAVLALWLPAYIDSLYYFAFLIPICVFDSKMNITCTTLFKVKRQEDLLLKINIFSTIVCAVLVSIGVHVFDSVECAIACATLVIIGRYIASEYIISKQMDVRINTLLFLELFLTIAFIYLTISFDSYIATYSYIALYIAFLLINRQRITELLSSIVRNFQRF